MPLPTIDGYTLLPVLCDWDEQPTLTLSWDTEVAAAVRGNEGRGALRRYPRPKYDLTFVSPTPALGDEIMARLAAGQLSTKCAVPFYGRASSLALDAAAGASSLTLEPTAWQWAAGDYLLVFSADLLAWAVGQVVAVAGNALILFDPLDAGVGALEAGDSVYPLFYGRAELDTHTLLSGDMFTGQITLHGQTYLIPQAPPAACPNLGNPAQFQGRPIFPFLADVSTSPTRQLTFDARATQVGFGQEVVQPLQKYVARECSVVVDLPDGCSISALERFFGLTTLGRLHGFWCAEDSRGAQIAAAADAGHVIIDAQDLAATWHDHPAQTLLFRHWGAGDDFQAEYGQIAAVAAGPDLDQETITLTAALGTAVDPSWDAHWLRYLRLKGDDLTITFDSENYGSAEIETVELPVEYAAVETGQRSAFCYHLWRLVNGNRRDWYFTSFDLPVYAGTAGVQVAYQPAPISHAGLEVELAGNRQELEIDTWMFDGNPLNAWIPFPPQYDLRIELLEVDLSAANPAAATLLFSGFVEHVVPSGKQLKVTATTLTDRLQAQLPRFRVQGGCNYELYGPCCKVNRAAYSDAVQVLSVTSDGLLMTVAGAGIGNRAPGWYQWGDLRGVDADGLPIYRLITVNIAVAGQPDQQLVRINAPFVPALVAGSALVMAAGCNLDFFTPNGCTKFNNRDNFGGHPYIAQNLSLKAVDDDSGGGK